VTEILYDVPANQVPSLTTQIIIIYSTRKHLMSQQFSWACIHQLVKNWWLNVVRRFII